MRSTGGGKIGSKEGFDGSSFSPFKTVSKASKSCSIVVEVNSYRSGRKIGGGMKSGGSLGGAGGSSSFNRQVVLQALTEASISSDI